MELEERIRQAVVHLKNVSGGDVAEHLIDEEFVINELVKFRHAELRSSAGRLWLLQRKFLALVLAKCCFGCC